MEDLDLQRIVRVAEQGLDLDRNTTEEDLHLDTFLIVAVWTWTDNDGDESEGTSVWAESRRPHVQKGIVVSGFECLNDHDTWG